MQSAPECRGEKQMDAHSAEGESKVKALFVWAKTFLGGVKTLQKETKRR